MKKPTPKKVTAADTLARAKLDLEQSILKACNAFERDTGLLIVTVRHPRDDQDGAFPLAELKPDQRVEVGVIPPFSMPYRSRLR